MVDTTPTGSPQGAPEKRPARWKKLLAAGRRILGMCLLALAGLLLVVTIVVLIPATRSGVLGWSVRFVDEALPGRVTVGQTGWPSLGHLVLEDILWLSDAGDAPGDTLADVSRLELAVNLGALRDKEGRVESIRLDVRRADLPLIAAAFEDTAAPAPVDSLMPASAARGIPYLRAGSLPGVPSVDVARIDLAAGLIRAAPGMAVRDLVFAGGADARAGGPATLVIDHAAARVLTAVADTVGAPVWEVTLDHLGLGLNLEFAGDGGSLAVAGVDSLTLKLAPLPQQEFKEGWRSAGPVGLEASARIEADGNAYSGRLDCDFVLPGSARFHPWLPRDFPHEEFGRVVGRLGMSGSYADSTAGCSLNLDLGSNTWLERGVIAGDVTGHVGALRRDGVKSLAVRLDTLDVALDGIGLSGSGKWEGGDAGLDMALDLDDLHLLGLFAPWLDPALKEVWRDPEPVDLEARVAFAKSGTDYTGSLSCDFLLPGSVHLHPWLPGEFPHEEFESLSGTLEFSGRHIDPITQARVRLDLGSNDWMDKGLLAASASGDVDSVLANGLGSLNARLDALDLDMRGVRLQASGEVGPGVLELELDGGLNDLEFLTLFAGPQFSDAEIDLEFTADLAGSLEDPEVAARVEGGFLDEGMVFPEFYFGLEGDRRYVSAFLEAGGGLEYQGTVVDSVRAEAAGKIAGLDSLTADFGLAVWEQENRLAVGGSVQGDSVRVVILDSLVVGAFEREMRTVRPVTLTLGPEPESFELTELEFRGEPGLLAAKGFHNDEGMDLEARVDLLLTEELLQLLAPSPLWSGGGGSDLKVVGSADLDHGELHPEVRGQVRAVMIPHRKQPPLGVAVEFSSHGGDDALLTADFTLTSADTSLLDASLVWPGKRGSARGFWNPDPAQDLLLTVPKQKVDLERFNRRLPSEVVLEGAVDLAAEVRVFPPGKSAGEPDTLSMLAVRGSIDASLNAPKLRVDLPNRSWLNTVVTAGATGSLADPTVHARVEITSGFIRVPELPRNLHPIAGKSMLWALNDSLAARRTAAGDTVAGHLSAGDDSLLVFTTPEQLGPALDAAGPQVLPELDLELLLTRDLRIMGYGADVKLTGGVKAVRGFDKRNRPGPSITGKIMVREGSLKVMNRVFQVERGNIHFTGAVPTNPNLDMMLETSVGGYQLRILISGKAADPVVEMVSEPDLSEEDIMAVLLFGQPLSDLDSDQRGRMDEENDPSRELQKNLAGLAMALGTRNIQDSMGGTLGVDVVQMGSDSEGGSTLMVGKFITPDIILKYNQSLEKSGTYFMTLEYTLNRYFKIISTYGQGEEASGAELQWSKRY